MNLPVLACILGPALLILWRWRREPGWLACFRYLLAIAIPWVVFMDMTTQQTVARVDEARKRGDVMGAAADTGAGAAVFLVGWVPGAIYAALLGAARRQSIRHDRRFRPASAAESPGSEKDSL